MSKRIVIDPVTRIEGHAKISIYMDDAGNVADAEFHVVEFRGFEKFCEGRPFSEMPGITQRICGICPVSHTLASAKAGDARGSGSGGENQCFTAGNNHGILLHVVGAHTTRARYGGKGADRRPASTGGEQFSAAGC